jgi:hypothetical protein
MNLHVFHRQASPTGPDRRPLAEGAAGWPHSFPALDPGRDDFALLELARGDQPEQLAADAATLSAWLAGNTGSSPDFLSSK